MATSERRAGFGALIRDRRQAAGLTQEALAARSGVSVETISQWERGLVRSPRHSTMRLLSDALGLDRAAVDELLAAARAQPSTPDRRIRARRRWPRVVRHARLLLATAAAALVATGAAAWALTAQARSGAPDRAALATAWRAYSGPGCSSPGAAALTLTSDNATDYGWLPVNGGALGYGCGPAQASPIGTGQAVAVWSFRPPVAATSCLLSIHIPVGSWAQLALYELQPGDHEVWIGQDAAAGGWTSAGPFPTSGGAIDVRLYNEGHRVGTRVVADLVLATCS